MAGAHIGVKKVWESREMRTIKVSGKKLMSQLLPKYRQMSLPARAGFWFVVCSFLQRGITMITTPIFTRVMTEEQFGLVSTYNSWQNVLVLITTLSLQKSIMNLYIKYENKERVLSAVSGLELSITGLYLIICLFFSRFLSEIMKIPQTLVICMFVGFCANAAISCWQIYKRYKYEYRSMILVTILMTALSSGLGVIAVMLISNTAEGRLLPQTIVIAVIGTVIYCSIFRHDHTFYDKSIWLFSLSFCIALLPHYVSEFVLQSSDKLMINYMCGPSDVAVYSVAYSVGSLITLVSSAVNSSFAPYQYQQLKAHRYEELSKTASKVLLLMAGILFGLMLFSKEIVWIFGGRKYQASTAVIVPICIGVYFNYQFQLFARLQEYFERKLTVVIPSILCAVLNLILNYIFIQKYGYQAAAYTTAVCYALFCMIHYFFYKRVCMVELDGASVYDVRFILSLSIAVVFIGILIMFINQVIWLKYGVIAVGLIFVIINRRKIIKLVSGMWRPR